MTPAPRQPTKRDVFIVFSKSEPLEAKFALAVKDGLEQLGRFAHEYEDWSWVEQNSDPEEDWSWVEQIAAPESASQDVDRAVLRSMLEACSTVLVIPPRQGKPSAGVAIELEMLARLQLPVVLLRWDLMGEEDEPPGLNMIYRYQVHGTNPNDRWISGAGPQIAELLWLACSVAELRNRHAPVGDVVLDALPAFGNAPLTAFKLRDELVNTDDYSRDPDLDALAQLATAGATAQQLRSLTEDWWCEAEPVLRNLDSDGYGPVRRPCRILHDAMRRVVERAVERFPDLKHCGSDAVIGRSRMLTRFDEIDEALRLLTVEIGRIEPDADIIDHLHATRALAHDARGDLDSAVADMDVAVRQAPDKAHELAHRFTRAVFRARRGEAEGRRAAIEDYTHILEFSSDAILRLGALNYRATHFAVLGEASAAITDWTAVIDGQAEHPRAAAQARFNRAVKYEELGKLKEARDDFTAVLAWADVSSSQRFRALEGRARVLEQLGAPDQAADDIEMMLAMNVADPEWRPELQSKMSELRSSRKGTACN